jgi:hypothetical protein
MLKIVLLRWILFGMGGQNSFAGGGPENGYKGFYYQMFDIIIKKLILWEKPYYPAREAESYSPPF